MIIVCKLPIISIFYFKIRRKKTLFSKKWTLLTLHILLSGAMSKIAERRPRKDEEKDKQEEKIGEKG